MNNTDNIMPVSECETILDKAKALITGERRDTHGPALETFTLLGRVWGSYLGLPKAIPADAVAKMMALLKICRTEGGEFNPDDYIDLVGYAALAGEIDHTLVANGIK